MQTTQRLPTNWQPTIVSDDRSHPVMALARSTELAASRMVTVPLQIIR